MSLNFTLTEITPIIAVHTYKHTNLEYLQPSDPQLRLPGGGLEKETDTRAMVTTIVWWNVGQTKITLTLDGGMCFTEGWQCMDHYAFRNLQLHWTGTNRNLDVHTKNYTEAHKNNHKKLYIKKAVSILKMKN